MNKIIKYVFVSLIVIGSILLLTYKNILFNTFSSTPHKINLINIDYTADVKPVLANRCVVCHACFDAPCQLKLGSYEGIQRGAHKERVYNGDRLLEANLTRLFKDGHTIEEWRKKGFFSVLDNKAKNTESDNGESTNLLSELLLLKKANPLPKQNLLPDTFKLDINQSYQCSTIDEISNYKKDYPLMGMPYGLPPLDNDEHTLLNNWLTEGAKGSDNIKLSSYLIGKVEEWELFFNKKDLKSQLMSRYLYEHLFIVHLYFKSNNDVQFFKLIRSSTAPGSPAKGIYTRRPFDDPKVERVYYRLIPVKETLVHKSHIPIALTEKKLENWTAWFLTPDYEVTKLPSYLPEEASNPFITFSSIPVKSRYNYMLDESQNTIMQFIKGPVCRGQLALNVINDHFWVVFVDPASAFIDNNNEFLQAALKNIDLPAEEESTALPTSWISYASKERDYLQAKSKFLEEKIKNKTPITLDLLWDGDRVNENAALTVFRHNDAASVVKGLVGEQPQTAWLLTYPLFERIHYLLVAGFDVYGNVGHQLNSRIYMDFLRMEGEFNFLSFLPEGTRKKVREKWYRGSVSSVEDFVYQANTSYLNTDINYKTEKPLEELYSMMQSKLSEVTSKKHYVLKDIMGENIFDALSSINQLQGKGISILPESTIIQIYSGVSGTSHFYTMLRHTAYSNISHLFNEEDRRLTDEDTVTIARGFMTSHPNAFLRIKENQLSQFVMQLKQLRKEEDYKNIMDTFGVRRTSKDFWQYTDTMHDYFKKEYPVEFGYLDFNRLENR